MMNIRTFNRVAKQLIGLKANSEEEFIEEVAKAFGDRIGEDYIWVEETIMDGAYVAYANDTRLNTPTLNIITDLINSVITVIDTSIE